MLISEIIEEIISELGGDTDDADLAAKILGYMKSALRTIPAFIRDRMFLGEDSLTLAVNSHLGDLSTLDGFIRERAVWYEDSEGQRVPINQPPSPQFFHDNFTPNGRGYPSFYRIFGNVIQFDRGASVATTVGFDYFKGLSVIEAGDTFFGNEQILEAVKHFTKKVYHEYAEDLKMAGNCERQGKEIIRTLEEEYEIQEQGGTVQEG